jgi:hypothetical protein
MYVPNNTCTHDSIRSHKVNGSAFALKGNVCKAVAIANTTLPPSILLTVSWAVGGIRGRIRR